MLLALGASDQSTKRSFVWLKSLTSIAAFVIGCFIFAFTRFVKPKYYGTLATSFILQSFSVLLEANFSPKSSGVENPLETKLLELLPLGFQAFQYGWQNVTSWVLGFKEVPATVFTSLYCEIATDPKLLDRINFKRN
ncbi:hypothetical protein PZA11_001709 [Diplocarpon coronariae]